MSSYHRTQIEIEEERLEIVAAQEDPRRFGVLYERYYEPIFLFVLKRVNDLTETGDVTAQVFMKAMMNLKRYRFQGLPFSAWLYRIAINEVSQYFRETKSQRSISLEKADLEPLWEDVEEEKHGNFEEEINQMLLALDALSPEDVQMVELRYFEKMPFREIAEIYNITENNAKVRMYRILARMKKKMGTGGNA